MGIAFIFRRLPRVAQSSQHRYGFNANGEIEYHGYVWRPKNMDLRIYVWAALKDAGSLLGVETVGAEIVFCSRQLRGRWPACQTEIHFHSSSQVHRDAAVAVWNSLVL